MTIRKLALVVGVLALVSSAWAAPPCDGVANLIYCQSFDGTGNAYSSQNDPPGFGLFAQVYDNFKISSNLVDSVHWIGEYFNPPNQGQITGWTVNLYADAAGQPGALIYSHFEAGTAGETFLGIFGGFPTYQYGTSNLSWSINPGVTYWLDVYPDVAFPPQWGWSSGVGGDGISYQDFFGARSPLAVDMAFALDGRPVPEPGIILMVGAGALGALGVIRRRLF